MYTALIGSIVVIGLVFIGLTVAIVINKALRESREARRRLRRIDLEPKVLGYAHGSHTSLIAAIGDVVSGIDRDVLEQTLLDHVQRVRGVEHERLARALEELGFVDRYIADLESGRWWFRARAAERLGLAGASKAVEPLTRLLEDETPEVRLRAAKALGLLGGSYSVRALVQALDQPNRWSTIRIADILTEMGRQVVDELMQTFDGLQPTGKVAAIDVLGRIRPLYAVPWMLGRLKDPHADVRARTCHAMGCIGDPNTAPGLIQALGDPEWPVRAMAAKALGRLRHVDAVPALCSTMADDSWWVRSNSAAAVGAMGESGERALIGMLDDEDRFARDQAVLMLEETGVVDLRVEGLGRGTERAAAEKFVTRLIDLGQTSRLRSLMENHEQLAVREVLRGLIPDEIDRPEQGSAAEGDR